MYVSTLIGASFGSISASALRRVSWYADGPRSLASQSLRIRRSRFKSSVPAEQKALQPLSIQKDTVWNPLTFQAEEIDKSMNLSNDTLMNQRIRLR